MVTRGERTGEYEPQPGSPISGQLRWAQASIAAKERYFRYHQWHFPQEIILPSGEINFEAAQALNKQRRIRGFDGLLTEIEAIRQDDGDNSGEDGFSPSVARRVLTTINDNMWSRWIFMEREINEGSRDTASFQRVLIRKMRASPEKFKKTIVQFASVLPHEGMVAVLTQLQSHEEPRDYIEALNGIFESYFDRSGFKPMIESSAANPRFAGELFEHFVDSGMRPMFAPEEQQRLVTTMLEHPVSSVGIYPHIMDKYIEAGFVNREEVPAIVIRSIEAEHVGLAHIDQSLVYFPQGSPQREQLRQTIRNIYVAEGSKNAHLFLFKNVAKSDLFTRGEVSEIIHAYAKANPIGFYMHIDMLPDILRMDEVHQFVMDAMRTRNFAALRSNDILPLIFHYDEFTQADRQEVVEVYLSHYPRGILSTFDKVAALVSPDEAMRILNDVLVRADADDALRYVNGWIGQIPEADRRGRLLELIERDQSFDFVKEYVKDTQYSYPRVENMLQRYITADEIFSLVEQRAETNPWGVFNNLDSVRKVANDAVRFKRLVDSLRTRFPDTFASQFGKIPDVTQLYGPEEIQEMIRADLADRPEAGQQWIDSIASWGSSVDPDFAWEYLQTIRQTAGASIYNNIGDWIVFVPNGERTVFVLDIIKANPAEAISHLRMLRYHVSIDEDQILQAARQDSERLAYAPRTLGELLRDYAHASSQTRIRMLREISSIYNQIETVRQDPYLGQLFETIRANLSHLSSSESRIAEKEVLALVSFLDTIRKKDQASFERVKQDIDTFGGDIRRETMQLLLFRELGAIMGVSADTITEESLGRFNKSMESLYPFMTYFLDQQQSSAHVELMKGMFESLLTDRFVDWKFWLESASGQRASLEELKVAGLVPAQIILEQYQRWQQEETTDYQETLTVTADSVVSKIADALHVNAKHLPDNFFADDSFRTQTSQIGAAIADATKKATEIRRSEGERSPAYFRALTEIEFIEGQRHTQAEALETAKAVMRSAREAEGVASDRFVSAQAEVTRLAGVMTQLKEELGRAQTAMGQAIILEGEQSSAYLAAKETVERLMRERERMRLIGLLRRFLTLTPQEVSENRLNNVDSRKYPTLRDVLTEVRAAFSEEDALVVDQVQQLLDSYSLDEGIQSISVSDTARPQVLLEIGARPVATCQHYETGGYRQALLAYSSEPNTKVLIVRGASDNILARAMFRLLEDSRGNPVLHVERIYTTVASESIDRLVLAHATKKASSMGVQLYTNLTVIQQGELEEGEQAEAEVPVPQEVHVSTMGAILSSKGLRAPYVYVDSAGGFQSSSYVIADATRVNP